MSVSLEKKTLARIAHTAFGGKPKVFEYWDDNKVSSIDILSSQDSPQRGITSFSSIGLSDFPIDLIVENNPLRVELVGACEAKHEYYANILATCAFNIINSNFSCFHGVINNDIVEMYYPDYTMKHILFVSPFLWEEKIPTLDLPDKKITLLQAVPIAEEERNYADRNGYDALESLLEQREIDIFDLSRMSIS